MSSRSSDSGSAPESPDCCRYRRSSTSPTCTTPKTSSAARRPACSSSPPGSSATRWWCGWPGLAYQKGFGGHFHNDNAVAVLRDIPGLVVAVPARGDDAAAMLRTCLAAADIDGSVCVFLEPIALYHTRDLYEPGDGGWLCPYAAPEPWADAHVPIGRGRTYGDGSRPHARDLRQRGPDVAAGGQAAGRDRDRRPRPGSAVAGPTARRRPAARGRRDRTGPCRR